jgi:hypothetical protein
MPKSSYTKPVPTSSPDIVVAEIAKGATSRVRVVLSTWRGQHKVHVREFTPGVLAGDWWPSNKGACVDVHHLPDLISGLQAAEAEARRRGLLTEGRAAA